MGSSLSFPVVDLSGKVALVTGGNTGIGYETAKALAVMGAHTIIACRSSERAHTAVERMKEEVGREFPDKSVTVDFMLLDLSSFQSTKDFTVAFRERNLPLHILINNAAMTEDGYEAQFQVNHLSHFLLTLELLPILLETAETSKDCRIIFVSSRLHSQGVFTPGNMSAEQEYNRSKFYSNSKLYNVMTAYSLQRRLENVGITVSSLHPGSVETELGRNTVDNFWLNFFYKAYKVAFKPIIRDAQKGATTTLNCAVNPELNSQRCLYYSDCHPVLPCSLARNVHHQEQLWEISINIIKDFLSMTIFQRYGPAMGFEEDIEQGTLSGGGGRGGTNGASNGSPRDRQVTISEDKEGTPMITFKVMKDNEEEEMEEEMNGRVTD